MSRPQTQQRVATAADTTMPPVVDGTTQPEPLSGCQENSASSGRRSMALYTLPFVILIFMLTSALLTASGQWRGLPYADPNAPTPPDVIPAQPSTSDWSVRVFNFLTWFTQFILSISCYYPILTLMFQYHFRPLRSEGSFLLIPSALHRYTILLYTASTAAHVFSMVGLWLTVETMATNGTPIRMWYQQILRIFHVNLAGQAFLLPYEIEPVLSDVIFAFHDFVIVLFVWLLPTALVQHQLARHNKKSEAADLPIKSPKASTRGNSRRGYEDDDDASDSGAAERTSKVIGSHSCRRLVFLLLCGIPLVMCLLALAVAAIVLSTIPNAPFPLPNLFYIGEAFSYVLASLALWVQARYHGDHKSQEEEEQKRLEGQADIAMRTVAGSSFRRGELPSHRVDDTNADCLSEDGAYYDGKQKRVRSRRGVVSRRAAAGGVPFGATWSDLPSGVQVEVHRLVAIWAFLLFFGYLLRTIAMGYRPAKAWVPLVENETPMSLANTVVSSTTLRVLVNIFILLLPAAYVTVQRIVLFFGRRWLVGSQTKSGGIDIIRMNNNGFFTRTLSNDVVSAWEDPNGNPRITSAIRSTSRPISQPAERVYRGDAVRAANQTSTSNSFVPPSNVQNPSYGYTDRSSTITLDEAVPTQNRNSIDEQSISVVDARVGTDVQIPYRPPMSETLPSMASDGTSQRALNAKGLFT